MSTSQGLDQADLILSSNSLSFDTGTLADILIKCCSYPVAANKTKIEQPSALFQNRSIHSSHRPKWNTLWVGRKRHIVSRKRMGERQPILRLDLSTQHSHTSSTESITENDLEGLRNSIEGNDIWASKEEREEGGKETDIIEREGKGRQSRKDKKREEKRSSTCCGWCCWRWNWAAPAGSRRRWRRDPHRRSIASRPASAPPRPMATAKREFSNIIQRLSNETQSRWS